jgi:hypothetical protein
LKRYVRFVKDQPEPSRDPETVEALLAGLGTVARTLEELLIEFENTAARAAEVCRAAAHVIAEGPVDEDAGTVFIVALEATARELEAVSSRALRVRTGGA